MRHYTTILIVTLLTTSALVNHNRLHAETMDDVAKKWVCVLDMQTHQSKKLFTLDHLVDTGSIAVTPDGTMLAISGTADPLGAVNHHIWVCRLDGSGMTDIGQGKSPSWSPRGKRIAFMKEVSGSPLVWVAQADGTNEQLIDNSGQCIRWSPDGLRIAYTRRINGRQNIVIFNIAEDEYSAVFAEQDDRYPSFSEMFAWSPDGKRICIRGETTDKLHHLASVLVSDSQQITVHAKVGFNIPDEFCWLNQETLIVAKNPDESDVVQLCRLDDDAAKFVPLAGQFADRNNYSMDVTGDGKMLVYLSAPGKAPSP